MVTLQSMSQSLVEKESSISSQVSCYRREEELTKIMIIGFGNLASHILNILLQFPEVGKIVVASRSEEHLNRAKNLSVFTAIQLERYGKVECQYLDLWDIEKSAEAIAVVQPSIILNTSTLQSWRVITNLPKQVFSKLDQAQFGPWLPMHLTLNYKLMLAVKMAEVNSLVVNAAFPDALNPVLDKVGLAPDAGIGNVANIIPALKSSIAFHLNVMAQQINVNFIAHHYLSHSIPRFGTAGNIPFHLSASLDGENITNTIDLEKVFKLLTSKFRRLGGVDGQLLTASSAARVLLGLCSESTTFTHAPGVQGLPGGYPIMVNSRGLAISLPQGVTLQEAVEINLAGQKADGIESIDEQGTVHFRDQEMEIMKRMLGYECKSMTLADSEYWANELAQKYKIFADKYPVNYNR